MLFVRVRSIRFISNSLAAATALPCFAFSPPSNQGPRPIFPHRAVKQKFHGATVKRSSWSQSGCSFCRSELSLGRSVGPPQLAHRLTRFFQSTLFFFLPPPTPLASHSFDPTFSNTLRSKFFRGYDIFPKKYTLYISRLDFGWITFDPIIPKNHEVYFSIPPFPLQGRCFRRIYGETVGGYER